jgi:hypothetical protein
MGMELPRFDALGRIAMATSEQKRSATWFGPLAASSPKRVNERPSSATTVTTGTSADQRPRGFGVLARRKRMAGSQ